MAAPDLMSRTTMRVNLEKFARRWRENIDSWDATQRGRSESSSAQTFWVDLLRQFGVIPERMNLFEADARRASTGGGGSIDVFWSGVFLGEAKSVGRDLEAAYEQALDYLAGGSIKQHEWPKYIIVTDFDTLRVSKLGDGAWTATFTVDDIADHVDQLTFLAGHETISKKEENDASIEAARIMARLYEAMIGHDTDAPVADDAAHDPGQEDARIERASIFLTRVLFLLYGDDAGLWREDLFYDFVLNYTRSDGSDLGQQLHALFDTLNTQLNTRHHRLGDMLATFPYVNGSLFTDDNPLEYFDAAMREALLDACRFRWTRISPAVFGSMFQLVKSKEARRLAGEHYTTETNILKTIEPLFLDDLRAEADRLIRNKSTSITRLRSCRDSLATHIFLDPASGCGNFLVVAYRELRRIETDIIVEIRRREGDDAISLDATLETKLTIGQFHGIEINWWPAKIAETAMFLVDHQANRELAAAVGQAPERLPITITAHIHHTNALQADWSSLIPSVPGETFVFGNPPFLGDHTRTASQLAEMQAAWGESKQLSRLDYVTSWHAKTLTLFTKGRAGAFAFVTTNSITQGDQPARLFPRIFRKGWRIRFAHRTFAWNSDAPGKAAVHCVIIGFDKHDEPTPRLWDYPCTDGNAVEQRVSTGINAYLVDGPNVLVAKRSTPLSPLLPKVVKGSMPTDGGNFILDDDEYERLRHDPVIAKYTRPYVGSHELINGRHRWCIWLADLDPADLSSSAVLRERVAAVEAFRADSKAQTTRDYPHHHLFRQFGLVSDTRVIGLPEVSSERRRYLPIGFLEPGTIISNKVYGAPDDGGLLFGLGSSSMFIAWMKAVGGRMKSDLSLSSTITWNNFPVPDLDDVTQQRIVKAGQGVLAARALHSGRSLADHYNPLGMDRVLVKAHDDLDRVVDRAFGAPRRLTSERQRLEVLFANYQALTSSEGEQAP